jgi:hypothetical protein
MLALHPFLGVILILISILLTVSLWTTSPPEWRWAPSHGTLPQVACPLWPISCTFFILITWIFIAFPDSSLSPWYLWRFKIWETYKPGSANITHHVGSGDCTPTGCSRALTIPFAPKSIVPFPVGININLPFICFLFDQIQPYCKKGAKWSEEYGVAHIGAASNR